MEKKALILFGHGARDPRWKEPFLKIQEILKETEPEQIVELAFLELMSPTLPDCVVQLTQAGVENINVIPVFFGQGGHIREDLPKIIAACRQANPQLQLSVKPAVGESVEVLQAIAKYCTHEQ